MRKLLRWITAAAIPAAAVISVCAPATHAAAAPTAAVVCPPGLGIGLAEEPKALKKDPRAKHYIIDFVAPGITFSRQVIICNGDPKPMQIRVFGDGATITNGTFALADNAGSDAISVWASVTPGQVTLAPSYPFFSPPSAARPPWRRCDGPGHGS